MIFDIGESITNLNLQELLSKVTSTAPLCLNAAQLTVLQIPNTLPDRRASLTLHTLDLQELFTLVNALLARMSPKPVRCMFKHWCGCSWKTFEEHFSQSSVSPEKNNFVVTMSCRVHLYTGRPPLLVIWLCPAGRQSSSSVSSSSSPCFQIWLSYSWRMILSQSLTVCKCLVCIRPLGWFALDLCELFDADCSSVLAFVINDVTDDDCNQLGNVRWEMMITLKKLRRLPHQKRRIK